MKQKTKFEFTLTGFIIGIILVSLFASVFGVFLSNLQTEYSVAGNSTLQKYNQTQVIINNTQKIRDATDIKQEQGILDVIGGYFTSGYSAIKISLASFDLFGDMMDDASSDIEYFALFKPYLIAIFIIIIFVGIVISVLVKMRV